MAQRSLKPFYLSIAGLAVVGALAMFAMSRRSVPTVTMPTGPVPVGADSVPPAAYIMGSDTAPVVVDDWSDFECPFCAQLAVLIEPDVKQRLIAEGLVQWRFHDFPLSGHRDSPTAHLAAACAADQDKFWPMHDLIYYNQGEWTGGDVPGHMEDYARQAGLDVGAWRKCMEDQTPLTRIAQSVEQGKALGITGTPTLFLNGRLLDMQRLSYDRLAAAIRDAAANRPRR